MFDELKIKTNGIKQWDNSLVLKTIKIIVLLWTVLIIIIIIVIISRITSEFKYTIFAQMPYDCVECTWIMLMIGIK